MNCGMGDLLTGAFLLVIFEAVALCAYMLSKHTLTKNKFVKFLKILGISIACTLIPAGPLSMMFGFPAALLGSILVTAFID